MNWQGGLAALAWTALGLGLLYAALRGLAKASKLAEEWAEEAMGQEWVSPPLAPWRMQDVSDIDPGTMMRCAMDGCGQRFRLDELEPHYRLEHGETMQAHYVLVEDDE